MIKKTYSSVVVIVIVFIAACGGETTPSSSTSKASVTESLFGKREKKAELELMQLIPPFPDRRVEMTGSSTMEQPYKIEGKVRNLTDRAIRDLDVRVTWVAPDGKEIASGRAYVNYWPDGYKSLESPKTCPYCYAEFRFDHTIEFTRDQWSYVGGELLRESKVKLEFSGDGDDMAFRAPEKDAVRIVSSDMIVLSDEREIRSRSVLPDEREIRSRIEQADTHMNSQQWTEGFEVYDEIVKKVEPFKNDMRNLYGEALCGRGAARAMLNQPDKAADDYALAFASANIREGMAASYGQKAVEAAFDAGYERYDKARKSTEQTR